MQNVTIETALAVGAVVFSTGMLYHRILVLESIIKRLPCLRGEGCLELRTDRQGDIKCSPKQKGPHR